MIRFAALALCLFPLVALAEVPSQETWVEARQTLTTADGLAMTYVEAGDPAGPATILLHGYTDNSRSWSLLAPLLSDRRLIMLDLRGHGGSAAPACCYGPDSMAHDVAQAMDALGIAKADVIGHSMGSTTAAVLAAWYPEKVSKLVLISTAIEVPAGPTDWLWANVPGLPDQIDPNGEFMLAWYWNPNPVPPEFLDRERAESAAVPRQAWMGVLQGLTAMDLGKVTPKVTAPVLILWGDQDSLFDAASQEAVRAAYPAAQFETFAGFGHNMFWEVPDQVAAKIVPFLAAP
ncbi:MAG: alpha/beta hydrolase [Tabrizicola sp.]|nr:alpha/beta hydrolase [Tabrizicola sp.]